MMNRPRRFSIELIFSLIFCIIYGSIFIYQSSVWVNGTRYFTLFDDAMISMTYAKNLLDGYGLNWAKFGEPVEGYTNPLWTFCMVPINAIPIPDAYKSLVVQIIGLIVICTLIIQTVALFKQLTTKIPHGTIFILGTLIGCFYPLMYWSLLGMETGLQALMIIYSIRLTLQLSNPDIKYYYLRKYGSRLFTVFSLAIFLRYDMIFLLIFCLVYLFPVIKKNIRLSMYGFMIVGIPNLLYLIFRIVYFHDILPNTFYLKMSGIDLSLRIQRGWMSFVNDFRTTFVWMALILLWMIWKRDKKIFFIFSIMLVYWAYAIYIGGDA